MKSTNPYGPDDRSYSRKARPVRANRPKRRLKKQARLLIVSIFAAGLLVGIATGFISGYIGRQKERQIAGLFDSLVADDAEALLNGAKSVLLPNDARIDSKVRPENISEEFFEQLKTDARTSSATQLKDYSMLMNCENYTDDLVEFYLRDKDRFSFVWVYPHANDAVYQTPVTSLTEDLSTIPHLLQWDLRWGYQPYLDMLVYAAGCGPTCMSMVASYLNQDPTLTPRMMCDLSVEYGDAVSGAGTANTFFEHAAQETGLNVEEIPAQADALLDAVNQGKPVILHMGPGNFTRIGHFIVVTGVEDGKLKVNDPNSISRTHTFWDVQEVLDECYRGWAFSKQETE